MSEQSPENDAKSLRRKYNAAVANGLMLKAKRIERRLGATSMRDVNRGRDRRG